MPKNDAELDANQPKKTPIAKSKTEGKPEPLAKLPVAQDVPKDVKKNDQKDAMPEAKADKAEVKDARVEKPAKEAVTDKDTKLAVVETKPTSTTSANKTTSAVAGATAGVNASLKANKTVITRVVAGIIAVFLLVVIIFGVFVYGYQSDAPAVKAVAGYIPYPVERVNGGLNFVTYNAYLFEIDANKKAIQNNAKLNNQPAIDFNSADGKKQVVEIKKHAIDKLKSDALTAQLAHKYKLKVTSKEVNDLVNQFYTRYGGKDTLLKTLKQYYGWNLNDLKGVIYKQLLAKKLEDKIAADPTIDAQTKAKANDVAKQIKAGGDFATIAKQSSQASDAANGGDLGTFVKGQVPEEIQKALDATPVASVSDPVKTKYGYEIVKVNSKSGDTYSASHILIKTVDFTTWFNDQLKNAKVNVYIIIK